MADKQAIVVRGGWPGHVPALATDAFVPFLRAHGYTVQVHDSPAVYADGDAMSAADLIVQSVSMSSIADEELAGLRAAVAAGTGLTGWHGGIVDSYRQSPEYLQLVGGQFVSHPGAETADPDGPADEFVDHAISFTALGAEHPVTAGLEDFTLHTEQYWVLHDDLNDVLATTTLPASPSRPWRRPIVSPAIWTRSWGEGRVVVSTPGHSLDVLEHPTVRTVIERGMLWATRAAR